MGVIQSELMISQAFQACYSIEGCLSDYCILSLERIGYIVWNIHQLNLLLRPFLTHSRELHLQPQELLRWRQGPRRPSLSEKYIRILQMLETQLKEIEKEISLFYCSFLYLFSMTLLCGYIRCHLPILHTFQAWPCNPALSQMVTYYLWWVLWYFKEFKNAKLDK